MLDRSCHSPGAYTKSDEVRSEESIGIRALVTRNGTSSTLRIFSRNNFRIWKAKRLAAGPTRQRFVVRRWCQNMSLQIMLRSLSLQTCSQEMVTSNQRGSPCVPIIPGLDRFHRHFNTISTSARPLHCLPSQYWVEGRVEHLSFHEYTSRGIQETTVTLVEHFQRQPLSACGALDVRHNRCLSTPCCSSS